MSTPVITDNAQQKDSQLAPFYFYVGLYEHEESLRRRLLDALAHASDGRLVVGYRGDDPSMDRTQCKIDIATGSISFF